MAGVPQDVTDNLSDAIKSAKVTSTEVVKCKNHNNTTVEAVVIVFSDGHTEVSCPVIRDQCTCQYGYRPPIYSPKPWIKNPAAWVRIGYIVAAVIFITLGILHRL